MSLRKKYYSVVFVVAMLMSFISVSALANNSSDTSFVFNFPIGTNVTYTDARAKVDNSSAYMKLQRLVGGTSPSYTASVVRENYSNFSKVWYYTFNKNNINLGRYLSNYAYEDDGINVKVRIKAVRGADKNDFYASGVWSPDSI